jgi:hypothetical protein
MKNRYDRFLRLVFYIAIPWMVASGIKYFCLTAFFIIYIRWYLVVTDVFSWVCLLAGLAGIFKMSELIENWAKRIEKKV